jgi:spore cortex formation protein SpoVR/YcgB (stage V sporulation)
MNTNQAFQRRKNKRRYVAFLQRRKAAPIRVDAKTGKSACDRLLDTLLKMEKVRHGLVE